MPELVDDTSLLVAFQKGESWAEKEVFDRLFEPLCLYSERITGDLPSSEDIVIESLTKGIDRRAEFPTWSRFKAFLYEIVRNASINLWNSRRRHDQIHEKIRYQERQVAVELDPAVLRAELLAEIHAEVEHLPDRCGQVFKLLFVEGLSTDEAAIRLGINAQTVRTQKARAISLIRTALLKKGQLAALLFLYAWLRLHSA